MPDTNDSTTTKRSPFSIGRPMRVLLIVFAVAFAVWVAPTARQRMLVAELESLGAQVDYDEQPCSILLKCLFGKHASSPVTAVLLSPTKPLTDDDLAVLANFPELTQLCLDGPYITDNDMRHVGRLPGLELVGITSTSTNLTGRGLAKLQGVDSLERLLFGEVTVTAGMLESIGTLNNLRELGFRECEFESSDFGTLASLPHLSGFVIMDSPMGDRPGNLDQLHALEGIVFHCVPITDEDCEQIGRLSHLKSLWVSSTKVSDAGLRYLSALHNLEYLRLQGQPVTDDGLTHLAGMPRLETLNLSHTEVSDTGLVHLAGMPQLEELHLSNTKVSDDGLVHLKGLEKLRWLDLASTQVSDDGLERIASIKSLRYLFLYNSKVSADGVELVRNMDYLGPDFDKSKQVVINEIDEMFASYDAR